MSYYQDANMYSSSSGGNNGNEFSSALSHAQSNQSEQSSDHPLFNAALSFLDSRKSQYSEPANYDVDEDKYLRAHNSLYNSGSREDEDEHDSDSLGAGAAMQALKQFTSGGEKDAGGGGGFDKNRLIGMAMSQAGRLWEEKNGAGKAVSFVLFVPPVRGVLADGG